MAESQATLSSDSRLGAVISPALDKIIKNSSWRKHSKLVQECKAVLEKLSATLPPAEQQEQQTESLSVTPLADGSVSFSLADAEIILQPLIAACDSGFVKMVEPALDCIQKLIANGYIRGEADTTGGPESKLLFQLMESVFKCHDLGDENIELMVLKTLLSRVTSTTLRIHGDCFLQAVRTCYNVYLGTKNVVNQTTAKTSLTQMLIIVFRRMEADSSTVPLQPIVVADLMEPAHKSSSDVNNTVFVQNFISKIIQDIDVVLNPSPLKSIGGHDGAFDSTAVGMTNPTDLLDSTYKDMLDAKYWEISMYKTALEGRKGELVDGDLEREGDLEVKISNKLRRDAFLVFRALCKFSMKSLPQEATSDPVHMWGKTVTLELLKILLENAGAVFRTSERQFNPPQSAFPSYSFIPPRPSRRAIQRRVQRSIPQSLVSALIAIVLTVNVPSSSDAFSDVPQTLSGADKIVRIQKPKSKQAESCTRKCVGTCIRGGAGAPGEGPLNIRRPLVVFKNGFRSRQYCLIECSDICNLIKDGDDGP